MEIAIGDKVEVRSAESSKEGVYYFSATVIGSLPKVRRYTVSYPPPCTTFSNNIHETVDDTRVRPLPPPFSSSSFRLHDCVDVFRDGVWWPGVVVRPGSDTVDVCFPLPREVFTFHSSQLRPHLEFLSHHWVLPQDQDQNLPALIFDKGARVEVAQLIEYRSPPLPFAWFPATVTKRFWDNYYLVDYSHVARQEVVHLHHLRPRPRRASAVSFSANDSVEAFYESGWHPGTVLKVFKRPVSKYAVRLPHLNKEMDFKKLHLRPCFERLHGSWRPSSQKNPDAKIKFTKGMVVEVSSDEEGFKGAWFGGTIIGPVGASFRVEYHKLSTDDETALLPDTIDPSHIRPVPPETCCGEVDAYCNDGWWVGSVSKVLGKNRYKVYFKDWKEEREFEHNELRPHYDWVGGRWVRASLALESGAVASAS
ncbi:hypothetical protein LUZ62_068141 [Rhynchospora pubera]|uniref:Agenet domain-containing protein n=1 Tax=Rhynchospora pubera TaxID=906938 RepID=A0AAV8CTI8_9POAL|nr:hypothetical protein LUZ62_068141 [Rhynchospora pubera]